MRDVRIFEASPNGEKDFKSSPNQESFKRALEANHLVFSERRGRFVMVLPVKTEPVYITNIKRGILSALQLQFSEKPQEMIHEVRFSYLFFRNYRLFAGNLNFFLRFGFRVFWLQISKQS